MKHTYKEHLFDNQAAASQAAAEFIAEQLQADLRQNQDALLVVSGGNTPKSCYQQLSRTPLVWERVTILLSDERWVAADHPDSNEQMVRATLLQDKAANAKLIPYFRAKQSIGESCQDIGNQIQALDQPFCCTLLGMGEDGHFASIFPDADQLKLGLNLNSETLCLPISTPSSPHQRISLTLSALRNSQRLVLLAFGEKKRNVLREAMAPDSTYPIAHLLRLGSPPVHLFWAP